MLFLPIFTISIYCFYEFRPVEQIKPVEVSGAESDEDEEDATDFFGLNAKEETPLPNQPLLSFVPQAQLFQDAPMPGPSRPTVPSNYKDQDEDEVPKKKSKTINDEVSFLLLFNLLFPTFNLFCFSALKNSFTMRNCRNGESVIMLHVKP